MGFFGAIVGEGEDAEIEVPEGWRLVLCGAAIDPSTKEGITTLWLTLGQGEVAGEKFALCHLGGDEGLQWSTTLHLTAEDNPVLLHTSGGGVMHVTGVFEPDMMAMQMAAEADESDEEDSDDSEGSESEDEAEGGKKRKARGSTNVEEEEEEEEVAAPPTKKEKKEKKKPCNTGCCPSSTPSASEDKKQMTKKEKKRAAAAAKEELREAYAEAEAAKKKKDKVRGEVRRLAGGLLVKDKVIGSGKMATPGKNVKIFYEGSFPNGKVFDKNFNRHKPLQFRVGLGSVITGMDRGIEGMRVGGTRELVIPAPLGYGKRGSPPTIPPNQTLHFTMELRDVGGR